MKLVVDKAVYLEEVTGDQVALQKGGMRDRGEDH
jgi:hypothetical protein